MLQAHTPVEHDGSGDGLVGGHGPAGGAALRTPDRGRDSGTRMHHVFETACDRRPSAIALICCDEQLTYRDLDQRANRLAHHLRQLGVAGSARVAVLLNRSVDMYVALLSIGRPAPPSCRSTRSPHPTGSPTSPRTPTSLTGKWLEFPEVAIRFGPSYGRFSIRLVGGFEAAPCLTGRWAATRRLLVTAAVRVRDEGLPGRRI